MCVLHGMTSASYAWFEVNESNHEIQIRGFSLKGFQHIIHINYTPLNPISLTIIASISLFFCKKNLDSADSFKRKVLNNMCIYDPLPDIFFQPEPEMHQLVVSVSGSGLTLTLSVTDLNKVSIQTQTSHIIHEMRTIFHKQNKENVHFPYKQPFA